MRASHSTRVLLYGKDARTDAIAEAIKRSASSVRLIVCAPLRIPGLVAKADEFFLASMTDLDAMVLVARAAEPDLVVIGPEDPLSVGLADALGELGIACVGPEQELAQIETSKSWARALVAKHHVPGNPLHASFTSAAGLAEYIGELGEVVVKPDGLTGGKGVKLMGEQLVGQDEALAYAVAVIADSGRVVIEEKLVGEEFSLMTITDGTSAVHCPPSQDHKRAFAGDIGPNTGGMGTYSCADHSLPFLTAADVKAAQQINEAVMAAIHSETGRPYRGVLFGGFMAVREGVRLIEYNARFGDPEAMNAVPILETDFVELARAVAEGTLGSLDVRWAAKATVCKYVVPAAYPEKGDDDPVVTIDEEVFASQGIHHYWAAADLGEDGLIRLTGSRGLACVGIADTLQEAEELAERGANSVQGSVRHRGDIGTTDLVERRLQHMNNLRHGK